MRSHALKGETKMKAFLCVCCLLVASLVRSGAADGCTFSFPSTSDPSQCEAYDLSKIATLGGANFTGAFSYLLTVCENLPSSSLPKVCGSSPPAPAYQYDSTSCVAIGNLSSPFAVSDVSIRCAPQLHSSCFSVSSRSY